MLARPDQSRPADMAVENVDPTKMGPVQMRAHHAETPQQIRRRKSQGFAKLAGVLVSACLIQLSLGFGLCLAAMAQSACHQQCNNLLQRLCLLLCGHRKGLSRQ